MKLVDARETPMAPPHETSNSRELLNQIDHYYPNLTGWLKKLRDDYEVRNSGASIEIEELTDKTSDCPHCGSTLGVEMV